MGKTRFKWLTLFILLFFLIGGLIAALVLISLTGDLVGIFVVKPRPVAYIFSILILGTIFAIIGLFIGLLFIKK